MTLLRYEDILTLKIGLALKAGDDGSAFFFDEGRGMRGCLDELDCSDSEEDHVRCWMDKEKRFEFRL